MVITPSELPLTGILNICCSLRHYLIEIRLPNTIIKSGVKLCVQCDGPELHVWLAVCISFRGDTMQFNRRTLLKGIGAAGATLVYSGFASASTGVAQYIVGARGNRARSRVENAGFTVRHELAEGEVLVVTGPEDAVSDLERVQNVRSVSRDVTFELELPELEKEADTFEEQGSLEELQWDNDIQDVASAHELTTGDNTRIAIIDTGIDLDHPDLKNVNEEAGAAFVLDDDVPERGPDDPSGHGTHVAGIAAATGDEGVVGVAPDAELIPIRVFPEDGGAAFGDILAGIDYAADVGADVANFSLGIPGVQEPEADLNQLRAEVQTVFQSVTQRGTVITGSAGNDTGNLQQGGGFTLPNSVPAVITVSATSPADTLSFYSNFGTSDIDVAAPGGWYETVERTLGEAGEDGDIPFPFNGVLSTYPTDLESSVELPGYDFLSGTSMAAPQVAGLVALVRALEPDNNANQVESLIKQGAELVNGQNDPAFGAGRINAFDTVNNISN